MIEIELDQHLDYSESKKILNFFSNKGVELFTMSFFGNDLEKERNILHTLSPFYLGKKCLEVTTLYEGESDWFKEIESWQFNKLSAKAILYILHEFSDGSLTLPNCFDRLTDWTFYKNNELFFGVISHEEIFFLRLDAGDLSDFKKLGFDFTVSERK